jgi:hypothetical protein
VLRALAASGPVVVAIDDVQWLDVPSARVLAFVVRRLEDAPIRFLVALRRPGFRRQARERVQAVDAAGHRPRDPG